MRADGPPAPPHTLLTPSREDGRAVRMRILMAGHGYYLKTTHTGRLSGARVPTSRPYSLTTNNPPP
jgi:hypothetical protein